MENQGLERIPVNTESAHSDPECQVKSAYPPYRFYRIPKLLFTEPCFREISMEGKFLYSLMLDRVDLSMRNGWVDDCGRVYIYFLEADAAAMLGYSRFKMVRLFKELSSCGMIERCRQGCGKPDRIYVKNFLSALAPPENVHKDELDSLPNQQLRR